VTLLLPTGKMGKGYRDDPIVYFRFPPLTGLWYRDGFVSLWHMAPNWPESSGSGRLAAAKIYWSGFWFKDCKWRKGTSDLRAGHPRNTRQIWPFL